MKCAVKNCNNWNKGKASKMSFFRFPSNAGLKKQWMSFCCRVEKFNEKTSFICMDHFKPGDFENSLQYEMGFTTKRYLKSGALPSIRKERNGKETLDKGRALRIAKRENKKTVEELLKEQDAMPVLSNGMMNIGDADSIAGMKDDDDMDQDANIHKAFPYQVMLDCNDAEGMNGEFYNRPKRHAKTEINETRIYSDCTVDDVLNEIGLYDELHSYLQPFNLDYESLMFMKEKHIDELFKDINYLRLKIVFGERLKKWQDIHKQSFEERVSLEISERTCKKGEDCFLLSVKDFEGTSAIHHLPKRRSTTDLPNRLMEVIKSSLETVLQEYKHECKQNKQINRKNSENDCGENGISDIQEDSFVNIELLDVLSESELNNSKVALAKKDIDQNAVIKEVKPSSQIVNNHRLELSEIHYRKRKWGLETEVKEILLMYKAGNLLLETYQSFGTMTPEMRTELVYLIVDHFVINHENLTVPRCRKLAEEIVELLPTECLDNYFYQEQRICPPKGKLWDRYTNQRQKQRKLFKSLQNPPNAHYSRQDGDEMALLCSKLKTLDDEKRLLKRWNKSFSFRRYQLQSQQFTSWKLFFDEYPFCKQPNYSQYIDADLCALYPNLKFDEILWDNFLCNFKVHFWNRITHGKSRELFDELIYTEDVSGKSDYFEIKIIELLHAVLNVSANLIEEAQRQFTVEVPDLGELKSLVIQRKKFCFDNGIQCKPYIAVVGKNRSYEHFSVVLDSTGFSCDSFQESVILCFKLYLFFDICFSEETCNTWYFIQKYFFNKHSIFKNDIVDGFILDIRSQKDVNFK